MDKLIEASSSGIKGWVAKNAAWATGYGVGKTTMNVDQDGNKFVIVMNGLSGERTYEFEVGVTKEIEDPRVKGYGVSRTILDSSRWYNETSTRIRKRGQQLYGHSLHQWRW